MRAERVATFRRGGCARGVTRNGAAHATHLDQTPIRHFGPTA